MTRATNRPACLLLLLCLGLALAEKVRSTPTNQQTQVEAGKHPIDARVGPGTPSKKILSPLEQRLRARKWGPRNEPAAAVAAKPSNMRGSGDTYRYNICNGLSNQLLYHASSIAKLMGYRVVHIPDYFLVQAAQTSDDFVYPSANNSVPFGHVFDADHFLKTLDQELGLTGQFVKFPGGQERIPRCNGLDVAFKNVNAQIVRRIIQDAFRPSKQHMQPLIDAISKQLPANSEGVCLHDRNGQDWMDHCQRWSSLQDGVYRGNCLPRHYNSSQRNFSLLADTLATRALDKPGRWVYYCGDKDSMPQDLVAAVGTNITALVSHQTLLRQSNGHVTNEIQDLVIEQQELFQREYNLTLAHARDFWALVDFYICRSLPRFVGNSVSTFSAIQIALRDGDQAYWYNSQSIPLGDFWKGNGAFQVPLVYTYTELSAPGGKLLLQASIRSVRQQMPHNRIHILYHGKNDSEFRSWLANQNVTLHEHDPAWKAQIEEMRVLSVQEHQKSHLFSHAGNYFGTWQRIDIPLFLEYEYALLLDADTVVKAPFDLADFGLDLTLSVAMSSEIDARRREPSNAGVMLMNIPELRRSHAAFLRYISQHKATGGSDHQCPSDQGAYLGFYKKSVRYMDYKFNAKPYVALKQPKRYNTIRIVHFHGPKPHDYLNHAMGGTCHKAFGILCEQGVKKSGKSLCLSLAAFAASVNRATYCQSSFPTTTTDDNGSKALVCQKVLASMAGGRGCREFSRFLTTTAAEARTRRQPPLPLPLQQKKKQPGNDVNATALPVIHMPALDDMDGDDQPSKLLEGLWASELRIREGISVTAIVADLGYRMGVFGWAALAVGVLAVLLAVTHTPKTSKQRGAYKWRRLHALVALCLGLSTINFLQSFQSKSWAVLELEATRDSSYAGPPSSRLPSSYLPCLESPFNSSKCQVLAHVTPRRHPRREPPVTKSRRTAALCLFVKDEHLYLNEFVDYHLAIGFDEIFVYDNSPDHNLQQWSHSKNLETNKRVSVTPLPGSNQQAVAYAHCLGRVRQARRHTWIANLDADEMLVLKQHEHVVDLLQEHCASGALSLYWRTFGHSNQTRYEPLPLAKRFQHASSEPSPLFKTIAKVSDVESVDIYTMQVTSPSTQHNTLGMNMATAGSPSKKIWTQANEVAAVHHFWVKSVEEWYIKACWRGRNVGGDPSSRLVNCQHSLSETSHLGDHFDDAAWRALKKFVPEYAVFDAPL